jgi:hypothetical protein
MFCGTLLYAYAPSITSATRPAPTTTTRLVMMSPRTGSILYGKLERRLRRSLLRLRAGISFGIGIGPVGIGVGPAWADHESRQGQK